MALAFFRFFFDTSRKHKKEIFEIDTFFSHENEFFLPHCREQPKNRFYQIQYQINAVTMENAETKERLALWEKRISQWNINEEKFNQYTGEFPGYIVPFLEEFLRDTYGDSLKKITRILKENEPQNAPLIAYIIYIAELIEPVFKCKLEFFLETFNMSKIENKRAESDYFGYLMMSNAEKNVEEFIKHLNIEVSFVGDMLVNLCKIKPIKRAVLEEVEHALKGDDIASKQFVILMAIYLEPEYRNRFIPNVMDGSSPIRARPKRFLYFVKDFLPENMRKLKRGLFSGLLEFLHEVRPSYFLLEPL